MRRNKRANANVALWVLVVCVIAGLGIGSYALFFMPKEEAPTGGESGDSKSGDLSSFKMSVEDDGDNPTRYAGTGYCYDVKTPNELIGGGSISLSASAGTTVSPVTIGNTYECIAFDSNHLGIAEKKTIKTEGEQLVLSSKNISGTATDWSFEIYEDGAKETTKSITIPAGSTDKFDKFIVGSEASDTGFNFKEICIGSNSSSSEISSIEMKGLSPQSAIPYSLRNSADFCFEYSSPQFIRDYADLTVEDLKITTTASFTHPENMTMYFLDEAPFEKVKGGIGYAVQDDTVTPATTGATDITSGEFSFLVVAS